MTNKEALLRFRIINRLLSGKFPKYPSLEKILFKCIDELGKDVSKRTIQADIYAMRFDEMLGYNAPIKYDPEKRGYYYEDQNYSIDKLPFNEEELDVLAFTSSFLKQYRDISVFAGCVGALQKIIDTINVSKVLQGEDFLNFIEFENVPFFRGSDYLDFLISAIQKNKVVEIEYQSYISEEKKIHILHPYFLKEYDNRWYVIGLHHENKKNNVNINKNKGIITLGLDRIKIVKEIKGIKYISHDFESSQYYRNTIGISAPQGLPSEVFLKFSKKVGQYILSKPIHASQELIADDEQSITIKLKVSVTYELIAIILSWGDGVEVLAPVKLRQKIKTSLNSTYSKY